MLASAFASAACRAPQPTPFARFVEMSLPTRNGILLVFDPGDCQLMASTFSDLNRLDALPGFAVRGVLLQAPEDSVELQQLLRSFGIQFPVSAVDSPQWESLLAREGLLAPMAVLKRGGRLESLHTGPRLDRVLLHVRSPSAETVPAAGARPQSDYPGGVP